MIGFTWLIPPSSAGDHPVNQQIVMILNHTSALNHKLAHITTIIFTKQHINKWFSPRPPRRPADRRSQALQEAEASREPLLKRLLIAFDYG